MDGQTIRNESATSRDMIDLPKAAASLVPLVLALASCNAQRPPESTPVVINPPEVQPTEGVAPTQAAEATPTAVEVLTPEQQLAKYLETDVTAKQSINLFVNAMKTDGIELTADQVNQDLTIQEKKDESGKLLTTVGVYNGTVLFYTNENGEWEVATPGKYWFALGKRVGIYLDDDEFKYTGNLNAVKEFFSGGVIALSGQVRPNANRPPSGANSMADVAKTNDMNLFFNNVVEPGKFPDDVNSTNVDSWLDTRFEGIIKVLKSYKTDGHPMYISFNEAWEGNQWNQESNPIRSKYGNKWVEEYTFQLLSKFVGEGLVPNQDFIVFFNDANLFNRPNKQDLVFKTLSEARSNAFNRMMSDSNMAIKLKEMGINSKENIDMVLGVQVHTKLGQNIDDGNFVPTPTTEQITNLSKKFESLGGILMTEFNPNGETEQQELFIKQAFSLLNNDPNLKGILLWNVFSPDDSSDKFSIQKLNLFNDDGTPTKLFFGLLSE